MAGTTTNPKARRLSVADVIDETADAKSIVFAVAPEEHSLFDYHPGQFLTLRIPSERIGSVARCYSLASSPHIDDHLTVTVKRTADGYGSNWLCDHVAPGDTIEVLPPSGHFTPPSLDADLLLFAAGSGITPVYSILRSVLEEGTGHIFLFYANRDERSVIFADGLRKLAEEHPDRLFVTHWLESLQGLPSRATLRDLVERFTDRHAYVCGPSAFMHAVSDALASAGVPQAHIHMEIYSSLSGNPFEEEASPLARAEEGTETVRTTVELDGETHEVDWPVTVPLVDVLLEKDVDVPYMCRDGECGACQATLESGKVGMLRNDVLDHEDVADGYVLTCQAVPAGDEPIRIVY